MIPFICIEVSVMSANRDNLCDTRHYMIRRLSNWRCRCSHRDQHRKSEACRPNWRMVVSFVADGAAKYGRTLIVAVRLLVQLADHGAKWPIRTEDAERRGILWSSEGKVENAASLQIG